MLRRLYHDQPASFAFTPENLAWAEGQIAKYPEGRQASAVIPLLWRAQEQEGWITRPAIEYIAAKLGMAQIRVLEVASFYFMFQLRPVGSVAHIQVCGTLSCMICGAEDLIGVCREKIADKPHELSADGKFSWEEVECLGACSNAPMAQIGKDYYEDLTAARLSEIIDDLAARKVPVPGPQNGRYTSEPESGLTSLTEFDTGKTKYNASVQLATDIGDTVKRIDGTEVPLLTPWISKGANHAPAAPSVKQAKTPAAPKTEAKTKTPKVETPKADAPKPEAKPKAAKAKPAKTEVTAPVPGDTATKAKKPRTMKAPRKSGADDLKQIKGVGPKLETLLHTLGFYHFDQIAKWTAEEVAWVDQNLEGFRGRATRDDWIDQAKLLAKGEDTEFSAKVKKGDVY